MIRKAVSLMRWIDAVRDEERELRLWMHSIPEMSSVMDQCDLMDVEPWLVVPLLRACKERYNSDDALPTSHLYSLIAGLPNCPLLPSLVSITPSDWNFLNITAVELAVVTGNLDRRYHMFNDDLNGDNWKAVSLALIKANVTLEVDYRERLNEGRSSSRWEHHDFGELYISGPSALLIISNLDRSDEIIDIMVTRKTSNAKLIMSIIDSDTKALSSGVL